HEGLASRLHLFLDEDRLFNALLGEIRLQNLDMGIAMRHIEVATSVLGIGGRWAQVPDPPPGPGGNLRYIATWSLPQS
ncbi:MAG TPA: hypothetical protein VMC79_16050, partial [Rectinemataceae bacterium]|nr:hypothetical protein [Rectinemataceae bacterium]